MEPACGEDVCCVATLTSFVAIVFVPFALLPYSVALAIWIGIELAVAGVFHDSAKPK